MQDPDVSWLLCSDRVDNRFEAAVKSCLEQDFSNFELIVVFNGGRAKELADNFIFSRRLDPRIRAFSTATHHLIFSLNLGLHFAKGELIARMDSDDVSYPSRLRAQVEFMRNHPDVAVLGTAYNQIDENEHPIGVIRPPVHDAEIRDALFSSNPICHPSVMFRKEVVQRYGGYMGGLHAEDYNLWARVASDPSNHFANLSDICLGYRALSTGGARRSREAYAAVAATQLQLFLTCRQWRWGWAAILAVLKCLIRGR